MSAGSPAALQACCMPPVFLRALRRAVLRCAPRRSASSRAAAHPCPLLSIDRPDLTSCPSPPLPCRHPRGATVPGRGWCAPSVPHHRRRLAADRRRPPIPRCRWVLGGSWWQCSDAKKGAGLGCSLSRGRSMGSTCSAALLHVQCGAFLLDTSSARFALLCCHLVSPAAMLMCLHPSPRLHP